ncbi:MAG: biopolymer transporter ExbD, partial [Bdellovibrionales bacterium]|nr:biopolymer transporter ExbD [Bdellovibrionales bacterium]
MLVLLVIFMITAPILQQGVEVNLPKATTAPLAGSAEQLVVSVDSNGKVFIGAGNEVDPKEIGKKVSAILSSRSPEDQKVYIKADQDISYGKL